MLYKYEKREIHKPKQVIEDPVEIMIKSKSSRIATFATGLCLVSGLTILTYAFFPYGKAYVDKILKKDEKLNKSVLDPTAVSESRRQPILESSLQNSNNFVENVNKNIDTTNKVLNIDQRTFPEYADIEGEMKISIPKLGLKRLPIKLNVNSFDPNVYMKELDTSLAHFKGTSLPDRPGNTFIYGHSANEIWAKTDPTSPRLAFTFLPELDIGDEIIIEYNGNEYVYIMQKSKMVTPEDISPIYTTSNDKVLTLMTCYPPGIGSERLIINAKLTNVIALN